MSTLQPWYRHPGRCAGVAIVAWFAVKLIVVLHLGLIGRLTTGFSGRLPAGATADPGDPVLYVYHVNGHVYHGWRRGIEYGGQELSVVHSPFLSRLHVATAQTGLDSPRALWHNSDYWIRLGLALGGIALGCLVERLWARFERRGGAFLQGLDHQPRR